MKSIKHLKTKNKLKLSVVTTKSKKSEIVEVKKEPKSKPCWTPILIPTRNEDSEIEDEPSLAECI